MYLLEYLLFLLCVSSKVLGTDPLLSSPGNTNILVIIDVHRNYDNAGSCTDPIWERLELAYSLWYNHVESNSEVGIEIYDGCSSLDQTVSILRRRLLPTSAANGTNASVASVVTFIEPEVDDAISGAVLMSGAVHVTLGSPLQLGSHRKQTTSHLYIDMSPRSSIEVLQTFLKMLKWTYLTAISDDDPKSEWKHQYFITTKDDSTCVQDSLFNVSSESLQSLDVKTNGVLLFTSTVEAARSAVSVLPPSAAFVIVTQAAQMTIFNSTQHTVIFAESFERMDKFVYFMTGELLQTPVNQLLSQYLTSQHNCSLNSSSNLIVCPDTFKDNLYSMTSGKHFHEASSVVNVLSKTIAKAFEKNCSSYQTPMCFDMADFDDTFSTSDMGYLIPKAATNASITWFADGSIQSTQLVQLSETTQSDSQLTDVINSLQGLFPSSQCSGWCPACQQDGCNKDNQVPFNGQYAFTPGDIVIAGMFPLTSHLELGHDVMCSNFTLGGNTDILTEAFLYAVQTSKTRYSDILQHVTVGSLVFDTCSDNSRAAQTTMNFESCQYTFGSGNDLNLTPAIVPAYVTYKNTHEHTVNTATKLQKLQLSVAGDGKIYKQDSVLFDNALFNQDAIISVLRQMEWSHVGIVTSANVRRDINMAAFFDLATSNGICIAYDLDISGGRPTVVESVQTIKKSTIGVFVIFADNEDVDTFLTVSKSNLVTKTWIVVESRKNWYDFNSVLLPPGSLLLQRAGKLNPGFDSYIQNKIQYLPTVTSAESWLDDFRKSRDSCTDCVLPNQITDTETQLRASDIIRAVDVTLHALDIVYRTLCKNVTGPCRAFYTDGFREVSNNLNRVLFDYEGETINLMVGYQILENYVIQNIQSSMFVEIGDWTNGRLNLDASRYKAYDTSGGELRDGRRSVCYRRCECLNVKNPTNGTSGGTITPAENLLDPEVGYHDSSGKFNTELWCIVVVIIAGSGAFATVCLMMYVMCKVCAGALVRRYLALGLMLLVSMVFLFMSVLPFVFTPSEAVCGMRYFAHGLSYALCYAIVLTKLTTLRDYRYIGLGGEISRINQLLSVFFITGVQVAIGIEWWVLRTPVVYSQTNSTIEGDNYGSDDIFRTHYACDFKRGDFLAYHSFVIFLICVCCLYSISVRKETNNMKEARLLLISSWVALVIWIALIVTLLVMKREYLEAICSVGILANALTLMVVIYFPKLTVISRLKYEVSDNKSGKAKGYKIDSDFHFERPYSLPGTLHSSVTDKSLSYPRSLKAFDTSLSY